MLLLCSMPLSYILVLKGTGDANDKEDLVYGRLYKIDSCACCISNSLRSSYRSKETIQIKTVIIHCVSR